MREALRDFLFGFPGVSPCEEYKRFAIDYCHFLDPATITTPYIYIWRSIKIMAKHIVFKLNAAVKLKSDRHILYANASK
jgi:hypothetical protein